MGNEIFIRPSRDVRTNYAEISRLCKKHPVAVTVNGREDSVIMSHEQYNELQSELSSMKERLQMYAVLANAEDDVKMGRVYAADEVFDDIVAGLQISQLFQGGDGDAYRSRGEDRAVKEIPEKASALMKRPRYQRSQSHGYNYAEQCDDHGRGARGF